MILPPVPISEFYHVEKQEDILYTKHYFSCFNFVIGFSGNTSNKCLAFSQNIKEGVNSFILVGILYSRVFQT